MPIPDTVLPPEAEPLGEGEAAAILEFVIANARMAAAREGQWELEEWLFKNHGLDK